MMKMLSCTVTPLCRPGLLSSGCRDKLDVSLVLSSPSQSLMPGHLVAPPIVAIEHVEQTHHLTDARPAHSTPHRPRGAVTGARTCRQRKARGSVRATTKNSSLLHLLFSEQTQRHSLK